ncbi:MAG: hypothetical protein MUC56_00650 [Thermoanaerobaculales bacterium]|nr:hypothetical protein [Thermoanaerobaculales bacterium]
MSRPTPRSRSSCQLGLALALATVALLPAGRAAGQSWPWNRSASPTPTPTSTPTPPGRVEVTITLLSSGARMPGADSVVWMPGLPADGSTARGLSIAQKEKQFEPRVAIVSVGSTVDFPNFDRVFHNVFSLSSARSFDLGLYRNGSSKAVRFDHPGLVQIYCNIHPHMAAYLMIVDSRRHAVADGLGVATLDDVPPGRHTVAGWNVRGGRWEREVTVRSGRTTDLEVEVDISSWRETRHLNKHGKEYPPPDDDDFRY